MAVIEIPLSKGSQYLTKIFGFKTELGVYPQLIQNIYQYIKNHPKYEKLTSDNYQSAQDYQNLPIYLIYEWLTQLELEYKFKHFGFGIYINNTDIENPELRLGITPIHYFRNLILPIQSNIKLLYTGGIDNQIGYFTMVFNAQLQLYELFKVIQYNSDNKYDLISSLFSIWFDTTTLYLANQNEVFSTKDVYQEQIKSIYQYLNIRSVKDWFGTFYTSLFQIVQLHPNNWVGGFRILPTSVYFPYTLHLSIYNPKIEFPIYPPSFWFWHKTLQLGVFPKKAKLRETNFQILPFDYIQFDEPKFLFVKPDEFSTIMTKNETVYITTNTITFMKYNFDNNSWEQLTYNYQTADKDPYQYLMENGHTYEEIMNIPFDKYAEVSIVNTTTIVPIVSNYHLVYITKLHKVGSGNLIYIYEDDAENNVFGRQHPTNIFLGQF